MSRFSMIAMTFFLLGAFQTVSANDGKALYETTCIACHGAKAEGAIPGVPNLGTSGRLAQSDAVLVGHIINGFQTPGSPMAMPPKGGNANLTDADAKAIVEYLRTVTGSSASTPSADTSNPAPAPDTATTSTPISAASSVAPTDMTAFARGAKAWADNCNRCHNLIDPKRLSDGRWSVVTTHMRLRAGLDGQLANDVRVFLQASN
jgi:cytochrome c5